MNPQITGCDKQLQELSTCIQTGGSDGGTAVPNDSGGGGFDTGTTCGKSGDLCFDNNECCSKSCDMDLFECK
jgi:hypothetical protein